jgi:hypothetical protein
MAAKISAETMAQTCCARCVENPECDAYTFNKTETA